MLPVSVQLLNIILANVKCTYEKGSEVDGRMVYKYDYK